MGRILEDRHIRDHDAKPAISEDTGQCQTEEAGEKDVHRLLLYTG